MLEKQQYRTPFERISNAEPQDYGITVKPANILVMQIPFKDAQSLRSGKSVQQTRYPVWLTTQKQGQNDYQVIGANGLASETSISWPDNEDLTITSQKRDIERKLDIRKVAKINLAGSETTEGLIADYLGHSYLIIRLPESDWSTNIAPFVSGWTLVSGKKSRSGPIRDFVTSRRIFDLPFGGM